MSKTGPDESIHGAGRTHVRYFMSATNRRLRWALVIMFLIFFAGLAIAPKDRQDWAMENALVFALCHVSVMACIDCGEECAIHGSNPCQECARACQLCAEE